MRRFGKAETTLETELLEIRCLSTQKVLSTLSVDPSVGLSVKQFIRTK